jgi:hypothetical protein
MTTAALARSQSVTIAASASVSGSADIFDCHVVGLTMPAAWTAAAITVQLSLDGTTWNDVYDRFGTEYSITTAASRYVVLTPTDIGPARFIRLRSGTGAAAVVQAADRAVTLALKPYA